MEVLKNIFSIVLLVKITGVPGHDERALRMWGADPAYMRYRRCTSLIIPLPPRSASPVRAVASSSIDSDGENRPLVVLHHFTNYAPVSTVDVDENNGESHLAAGEDDTSDCETGI